MAASDQRVIATAGILSVSIGSANSILKNKQLPSTRFLIGSGIAYLILSALAEGEPELAKGLAMGVLTTVLLGEGGGVLSYINQRDEINTQKKPGKTGKPAGPQGPNGLGPSGPAATGKPATGKPAGPQGPGGLAATHVVANGAWRLDNVTGIPGFTTNP